NIFAQSPLRDVHSSYGNADWRNDKYMLSSGGTQPVEATIGWAGGTPDVPPSKTLHLLNELHKIDFLEVGYLVIGVPPESPPTPNPIQPGTTVTGINKAAKPPTVTLSKPLVASTASCAFRFKRPVDDYASDAMIRLWY